LAERRATIDRYLRAFEARRLPESSCADRLAQLDREVQGLEVRAAALEVECDTTPTVATGHLLVGVRERIERAAAHGAPEQLKQPLDAVVEQIHVGVPRVHPAVFRRAHGSYASQPAEADGNRTRLSRGAAHTGFEDLNSHANGGSNSKPCT
jgi:hypothetical protein